MKLPKILNITASVFTIFMGVSHIFVPFVLPWQDHLDNLYAPITWALYAMNFFFSILLAWGGILTLIAFTSRNFRKWINGGIAAFWIIGGIYEVIYPFPIAEARWVLPIIAFFIAILYVIALFMQSSLERR